MDAVQYHIVLHNAPFVSEKIAKFFEKNLFYFLTQKIY